MSFRLVKARELGGRHTVLPRGSLAVREPRELLVGRPAGPARPSAFAGAFAPDGLVSQDTLGRLGETPRGREVVPKNLIQEEPVQVHEEEVLWGGQIASHFGHFLCESVARLWPLLPGAELEGMPVVFTTEAGRPLPRELPFVREWLDAFGARQVELPERGTVRFAKLRVPEPAWRISAWIAPEIRDVHLQARQGLDVPPPPRHDVLWLSRQGLGRRHRPYDEALLEWLLGAHVAVVRPEASSLAEQVAALEGSRAVAGVAGSAFHALLMAADLPECLYLCPPWDNEPFPAQHRIVEADATFAQALGVAAWTRPVRERAVVFPFGYRVTIPEALRALSATVLPNLCDDARLAAFSRPEAHWPEDGARPAGDDLDAAVARVLLDPVSIPARIALGELFEAEGLARLAEEQLNLVADLAEE